ncbi:unnamed protein product [Dimorphilus gyrociliatus]|uniref:Vesicle transport protein USE1 n=1 Tax=Dimorphilus gyrociliatus TaxID=2664684 RepID=A0A7I8VHF0_9ANNE|nr:unnamed protein product [Dimorphilus gyrociliatus]
MLTRSKLEINFLRLLKKCEELAEGDDKDWRFESYVTSLQDMLSEIKKSPNKPMGDKIREYGKSVEFLQNLLASQQLSTEEKCVAAELFAPESKSASTLRLTKKSQFEKDARKELMGESRIRKRNVDAKMLLKEQEAEQDSIVEKMKGLTSAMKHQAKAAGDIIVADRKKVEDSLNVADTNYDNLKVESDRLEEYVVRSGCSCAMWLMLIFVVATFIGTVLFMRLFPKKR